MGKRVGVWIFRLLHGAVNLAALCGAVVLCAYAYYSVWDTDAVVRDASPTKYEIYKPEEETLGYDELKSLNTDVIGWISVYGTNIDYPLLQAEDNSKYLTNNSKGEYSLTGSIFLDYRCDPSFADCTSVIHGHHMDQSAMFGDLDQFEDESFFEEHRYGSLYYDGQEHGLEFVAFLEADAGDGDIYRFAVRDAVEQAEYLENLKKEALYWRDTDLDESDHLVLLSTCMGASASGRYLLAGRITEDVQENPWEEEDDARPVEGVTPSQALGLGETQLALVTLLLLMALAAVGMLRRKRKR